ncbi:MAG: ribosome maturation factor RimP [Desulfovibrio sp.]|jgi:ribosome maturation factor RimP|nr:ribosome maturation factor RimP [Desulfovibrio sp.]
MKEELLRKNIIGLAEPVIRSLDLVIWGLEILHAARMIIRLYVDVPSSEEDSEHKSPSVEQCEEISRHLALSLDVEDLIDDAYALEVSTPGFSRIFFNLDQMRPYVGEMVEVKLCSPVVPQLSDERFSGSDLTPRRLWRGKLSIVELENDIFVLEPATFSADGDIFFEPFKPLPLSWNNVHKANRFHIFKRPAKPGKKAKAKISPQ